MPQIPCRLLRRTSLPHELHRKTVVIVRSRLLDAGRTRYFQQTSRLDLILLTWCANGMTSRMLRMYLLMISPTPFFCNSLGPRRRRAI